MSNHDGAGSRPDGDREPARAEFVRILNAVLESKDPPITHRQLAEGCGWSHHTRIYPWLNYKSEPTPEQVFAMEDWLEVAKGTLSRPLGYLPADMTCPACGHGSNGSVASGIADFERALVSLPFLPEEIYKAVVTIVARFKPDRAALRRR